MLPAFPLSVTWNVDPVMFSVGSVDVRWYSIIWMAAFLFGMYVADRSVRQAGYPHKVFVTIFYYTFIGTVLGARLGHCLFYAPGYFLSHPLEILLFRHGGLASHGAAIGILVALILTGRKYNIPALWMLDRTMFPVALGGALVRLGNLMNSEIYGTVTDLPWGFVFVRAGETLPKHPTQIYEALCYFATFALLVYLAKGPGRWLRRPGFLFGVGLTGVFLPRFVIEFIKNPQEYFEADMTLMMGQWLSLPFIAAGIWLMVRAWRRPPPADYPKAEDSKANTARKDQRLNQ